MKPSFFFIVLVTLAFSSLFIGVGSLSITDLFQMSDQQSQIFWASRLPRMLSIVLAGAGMAIGGLIMQQLTQNKFVSPTTAGTMDSARFGILISILYFGQTNSLVQISVAVTFSIIGTLLFMALLKRIKQKDPIFIPLVGLMFGNIIGSITTFIAYKNDLIQNMTAWLQGNFATMMTGSYELLLLIAPLVLFAFFFANRFTVAGMGEDFSKNLGINHKQIVHTGLITVAVITSVVVVTVGMIPFLGLVVPNIISIFMGDHVRRTLPITAMAGSIFVLLCDMIGRLLIYPYEIPIGLTVGVIGSGIFLILLIRRVRLET
ncbi:ABC transporter permease [Salisediminibacterium beveridgei]|uniref:Putative iron compound ABC uptake transporter, permease protein n=1 Tax=Salisediminibacterium beveridgei TaxID=632773 RepID=A0A1D7QXQ4_9BACI|nr:iron chelate uptake ABC transporter family permease subunit [Salisediminibacterium beveridgei]AOM83738.1 putative iron compound ABC uptake transporter, permease protein [Salisediminibacterium beveridgei]